MSDTPRTDARIILMLSDLQSGTQEVVHADFARQLEKRINQLEIGYDTLRTALRKSEHRAEAAEALRMRKMQ